MRRLPLRARAVVVVGVHVVVVHVHPRQKGGPRGAAHGRRDVGVPELGTLVPYRPQGLRHEVERTQLDVLVVGEDQDDVGLALAGRRHRRQQRGFPAAHPGILMWFCWVGGKYPALVDVCQDRSLGYRYILFLLKTTSLT